MNTAQQPKLYISAPHPCPYIHGKTAGTVLLDPAYEVDNAFFGELLKCGFRRSGASVYRPHCEACEECISVRISARAFRPNRAQRRARARNRDLVTNVTPPVFAREHFDLYCRYQSWRHRGDLMDHSDPEKYRESMVRSPVETVFIEHRLRGKLAALSICDLLGDGMSAVYTFFAPELRARSLGTFAILKQLDYVRAMDLEWLYLGHFVAGCAKMDYKINFRPIFGFVRGEWRLLRL